jgi:hypothetical protein
MTTLDYDKLAERAIDRYYDDDIYDHDTLSQYIEEAQLPPKDNQTMVDKLTDALGYDIKDLLDNGNDEDLAWSEADVEALRDGDYYDNLHKVCSLIASKLIARIYGQKDDNGLNR